MKTLRNQQVGTILTPRARAVMGMILALLLALPADAAKGGGQFKEGRKAEAAGDYDKALEHYEKARSEDNRNPQYTVAVRRTRFLASMAHVDRGHKLRDQDKVEEALAEFRKALAIDPASSIADAEIKRTLPILESRAAGQAVPPLTPQQASQRATEERLLGAEQPAELMPLSRAPINLRATNEAKVLFETIGKLAGFNVLADPDYATGRRITVELNNVTLEDALDHIGVLSKTLWKPLSKNTILIYQDNKRRDHDPQVVKTVYLTNTIQPQEITEITQVLRNLLEMNKLQQVNSQNAIVLMGTPEKVAIAEKIINDVDKAKPEVVIDVAVMQVRRDISRQLGLTPVSGGAPGIQIPGVFTPGGSGSTTTSTGTGSTATTTSSGGAVTLRRLGRLGSGDFSVTVPGASLNALMSDARTKILQNPQVRVSDGVAAKLRIGERIPIATGSFQPGIGGVGINPLVNTQFQYTDVGVIMEITPKVHGGKEISMKVLVEISSVTSRVNIGGIDQPVIGQRRVEEEIRLREGEANVLGGIIEESFTTSTAGVPFLGQIPIIGKLFSTENKQTVENEVLIVLTPHVVRLPDITELNLRGVDAGTQTAIGMKFRPQIKPGATTAAPAAQPGVTPATAQPAQPVPPAVTPAPTPTPEAPPAASVQSATQLKIPDIPPQDVGGTFNVDVEVVSASNVQRFPLQVVFDQVRMKLVNAVAGPFMSKDGKQPAVTFAVDTEKGTATVALSRPPGAEALSGSGVLVTLTFQATARGTGSVEVRGSARGASEADNQVLPAVRGNVQIAR